MSKAQSSCVRGLVLALGAVGTLAVFVLPGAAWASSNCPNEALRVGPSANLPDCRAYELVSPPNKNGGQVEGGFNFAGGTGARGGTPYQASLNGEAVTYASAAAFDETEAMAGVLADQYLSRRTAAGWRTQEIVPAQEYPEGRLDTDAGAVDYSLYQGFSEDLSHAVLLSAEPPLVAGAPAGYYNPYLRNDLTGAYTLLNIVKPPVQTTEPTEESIGPPLGFISRFAGFSSDYEHVIFEADDALATGAVPGRKNLYEYNEGEGLELVSVLPDGKAVEAVTPPNREPQLLGLEEFGRFSFGGAHAGFALFSPSYVHAISSDGSRMFWTGPEGVVYMHERGGAGGHTVQLSAGAAQFWAANVEGSLAYFTGSGGLYQYDADTGQTVDISAGGGSVFGISEDGSYVYFKAGSGFFVWHDGRTTMITPLGDDGGGTNPGGNLRTSRVTPNGQFLVFESSTSFTGYDNDGFKEVYEYDADTNKLTCVSCNPTGLPPLGNSETPGEYHTLESVAGWESSTVQQRYVNDEGTRVFFDSEDELVPQASNHKMNVYEYEAQGAGSCDSTGGCIYLISSGASGENSWFVDASADGDDVFFLTNQQLVGQDIDEALDVYDARVDGGFPYGSPPPCGGEACRPAAPPAPQIYTAPSSETFEGAGNQTVAPTGEPTTPKPTAKKQPKQKRKAGKQRKRRAHVKRPGKHARRGRR